MPIIATQAASNSLLLRASGVIIQIKATPNASLMDAANHSRLAGQGTIGLRAKNVRPSRPGQKRNQTKLSFAGVEKSASRALR